MSADTGDLSTVRGIEDVNESTSRRSSIGDDGSPEQVNTLKSWPSSWQDGSRRSAFQLYRPTTILTNLQRGNIQARSPVEAINVTWFEKAGRGDLTIEDVANVHDINVKDEHGLNALMWSAAYGHTATVQRLISSGIDLHQKGRRKQNALHLAAVGGHHCVVRLLVSSGVEINDIDTYGNTPLMYAVFNNHIHTINELLKLGADITIKNFSKQWPYQLAIEKKLTQAQALLETYMCSQLLSARKLQYAIDSPNFICQ